MIIGFVEFMNVSAVLIVKNEEDRLGDCLESLAWTAEIIVVDSGSTDNTLHIAKRYTDKVYVHNEWLGFGKQRQLAQEYATCDWVFAIDADEVVTPKLKESVERVVQSNNQQLAYAVNRKNWAFGRFIHHSGWSPDWVTRLYPREKTSYCDSLVHESVLIPEWIRVEHLPKSSFLLHYTYDNLHDYNVKVAGYLQAWADQRIGKKNSSIFKGLSHGVFAFFRMYIFRLGFLDGRHGFILAFLTAYTTSLKYFDLSLRQQENTNDG
jgi:(heptosyl)LPS beta-1,4-glucosyltransferase